MVNIRIVSIRVCQSFVPKIRGVAKATEAGYFVNFDGSLCKMSRDKGYVTIVDCCCKQSWMFAW